jgi:hypothetical protein
LENENQYTLLTKENKIIFYLKTRAETFLIAEGWLVTDDTGFLPQ